MAIPSFLPKKQKVTIKDKHQTDLLKLAKKVLTLIDKKINDDTELDLLLKALKPLLEYSFVKPGAAPDPDQTNKLNQLSELLSGEEDAKETKPE